MRAFFNYLTWLFFVRPLKQKVRTKALQSLRLYVKAVSGARKASMLAVLGIIGLSSITVGFFLLIGGLLWLANLNPAAYPWIMVGIGALLTAAGIAGYIFAFRQKLWINMSQINELTEATLKNFSTDERPANPAVTAMWGVAAEARIREHSRLENQMNTPPIAPSTDAASAASFNPADHSPRVETPIVGTPTVVRPARRIDPSLQPS